MKKTVLSALVTSAILLASSLAFALATSGFSAISRLDVDRGTGSYFVTLSTPFASSQAACGASDYIEIGSTVSPEAKELINKTLLAAFLAGRKVSVQVSSNQCGATGRPALYNVSLDAAQ